MWQRRIGCQGLHQPIGAPQLDQGLDDADVPVLAGQVHVLRLLVRRLRVVMRTAFQQDQLNQVRIAAIDGKVQSI